jgi:hypothetical protein
MKRRIIILFLAGCTGMVSCQRVKDKSNELVGKTKNKIGEAWKKKVDETFDALTTSHQSSFGEVFGTTDTPKIEEIDGLWIDWPASFYYGFLKYKADKKQVLDFIIDQPTTKEDYSGNSWTENNGEDLLSNLHMIETDHPHLKKKLTFFYELRDLKGLAFYQCDRFPKTHYIAFDAKTGIVYHHFENSAD